MDEQRPLLNRESFVIRLWQRETEPDTWLGEVQHVASGETAVFPNLGELPNTVRNLLNQQAAPAPKSIPSKNKDTQ